jgi:dTDP-4-dehydrorhamnose reductase
MMNRELRMINFIHFHIPKFSHSQISKMKNILITGADGQLGNELRILAHTLPETVFLFTDYKELDICSAADVEKYFEQHPISYIINCAAYTAVDNAEKEPEKVGKINAEAAGILGRMAAKYDCPIIHISSDYVFAGIDGSSALSENSPTNPISVYGKTKLEGEKILVDIPKHIIIRTSWLYSSFGNNFVKTMIRLGNEKEKINVIFDQIGTPTYAADLAETIVNIIKQTINYFDISKSGIYHYSDEGVTSWYDFAYEIKKLTGFKASVFPIETREYPTLAERPRFTVMNKQKIKNTFNISIPHWTESLRKCIEK